MIKPKNLIPLFIQVLKNSSLLASKYWKCINTFDFPFSVREFCGQVVMATRCSQRIYLYPLFRECTALKPMVSITSKIEDGSGTDVVPTVAKVP
ncbi:MAG: hypothetical protein MI725_07670, partial [Pirellulales bacterium]|nr:hypothetical protein [Pirellulales bacterium]